MTAPNLMLGLSHASSCIPPERVYIPLSAASLLCLLTPVSLSSLPAAS